MDQRILAFLLLAGTGCAPNNTVEPEALDDGQAYVPLAAWRTASAEAAGFDRAAVERLVTDVGGGRYGGVDAVLVIRNGYLVAERYNGWSPTTAHTMQSVTKSVTSLLFGVLAGSDARAQLDHAVLPLFPRYATVANVDDRKRALTLRHLLSMRTSLDFWEQPYAGSPLEQLNRSAEDWVKLVLDRPMTGVPGTAWSYNSGAPIVMCGVIRELAADSVQRVARRMLFEPIGVSGERWIPSPHDGLPHCGGGLYLKPADLARIGYLVLRKGRWGDRQVVSQDWIEASTTAYSRGSELFFANWNSAYGYYWWLFPRQRGGSDSGVIAASGAGGQWLFVVPDLDIVVVVVGTSSNGLDVLYNGVLPALSRP